MDLTVGWGFITWSVGLQNDRKSCKPFAIETLSLPIFPVHTLDIVDVSRQDKKFKLH